MSADHDALAVAKSALRRSLRDRRTALDPTVRARASAEACAHVRRHRAPRREDRAWALFASLPDEVDASSLASLLESLGLTTLYPRVEGGEIGFVPSSLAALVPGHFGVREPRGAPIPLAEAAVVIVPGLGFDDTGGRLGYGRGYYDRALAEARRAPRPPLFVGLGLELQRVPSIPMGPGDQRLDALVTEAGWLSFGDRSV